MGTYTANYNLYMPTIGEQGWGELINGNYQTIDATMKGLSNRAAALENADTAFDARITALEAGEFDLNGRINISTNATSGDIKLFDLSFDNPSKGTTQAPASATLTCNPASTITTRYNTSAFNYVGDSPYVVSTCTINPVVYITELTSCTVTLYVTVVNNNTGATVLSTTLTKNNAYASASPYSFSCSFSRDSTCTYTITITCGGTLVSEYYARCFTYTVSTSTPNGIGYLA